MYLIKYEINLLNICIYIILLIMFYNVKMCHIVFFFNNQLVY